MNDDLLDLLGKLYIELKIAHLLRIPFAEFAADYEEYLHAASMHYVGGGVHAVDLAHQDRSECMIRAPELDGLMPEIYRVPIR